MINLFEKRKPDDTLSDLKEFKIAGGGDSPQQQMEQMPIVVELPPAQTDNTLLWASSVIVPIVVAVIGLWAVRHRKQA